MIGFSLLMLLMGTLVWLGLYRVSWDIQDAKTRPTFVVQLKSDCMRLFGRDRVARSPQPATRAETKPVVTRRSPADRRRPRQGDRNTGN